MSFADALAHATRNARDPVAVAQLARAAQAAQEEAAALPLVEAAAHRIGQNAQLWQWTGLLRCMMGERDRFVASYERALGVAPRDQALWHALIIALVQAGSFDDALDAIARARAAIGGAIFLDVNEAVARSETGDVAGADALFSKLGGLREISLAVQLVRHRLRNGRVAEARLEIDQWLDTPQATLMWPYAALGWRLADDPRRDWLEGDESLVSVVDLADRAGPLDALAARLRALHRARDQHLDQSVRGGTQTDGVLFARIEPELRTLRAAVVAAVAEHVARLPAPDPRHPTLRARRDRLPRFAGSWSVRLRGGGHHANHIHPQGWLSSAFYVALPQATDRDPHAGWLTLGAPQAELGLGLAPSRLIEPKLGRLVLFPSTMWHGTVPFENGERLTVAFDVLQPL